MDLNESIGTVRNLESDAIISAPLTLKSLGKEPIKVIPSPEFGTGLPGATTVIANDTWDVDVSEFISKHSNSSGQLFYPEEGGSQHGILVGFCEFVMDVATEDVASEEEDTTRIIQPGEVIIGKKDDLLKELAKTLDSDLSVVCVTSLDFVGGDNFIEVGVRQDRTDYASFFGLLLGTKPRGWLDRTGFQIGKKINLPFKRFKFRCQALYLRLRYLCISFIFRSRS